MADSTPSTDTTSTPRTRRSTPSDDDYSVAAIPGVAVFFIAGALGAHVLIAWFLALAATCLIATRRQR